MSVGPVLTLGLNYTPSLIVTLGYGLGAAVVPPVVVHSSGGGGWMPQHRRRTRKELHAERVRLGILPPDVVKAANKVAAKVIDEPAPLQAYAQSKQELDAVFLRELGASAMLPDWSRAIQAAIRVMQDEEDDLLMLM